MSNLSKLLGLDRHPEALGVLNHVGNGIINKHLTGTPPGGEEGVVTSAEDRLNHGLENIAVRAASHLGVPTEEAGLAVWWLSTFLKVEAGHLIQHHLNFAKSGQTGGPLPPDPLSTAGFPRPR